MMTAPPMTTAPHPLAGVMGWGSVMGRVVVMEKREGEALCQVQVDSWTLVQEMQQAIASL